MATDTESRLCSWLDTNQRDRERLALAVLALDQNYREVRPRHPSGGPDGGRDIEGRLADGRRVFGAVGFVNGANDSGTQKSRIRKKFNADLAGALGADPSLKAFVFFTNVNFTLAEQEAMKRSARSRGIETCEIMGRERLRIELDAPSGFFIRFQYLGIPLSEAEQASFLSRYGEQIQEVVATGFDRVENTLDRLLFLTEASDILKAIYVRIRLKRTYTAAEIGHFRAYLFLALRAVTLDIFAIEFGTSDKPDRFREPADRRANQMIAGIANGIGSGQWEKHIVVPMHDLDVRQIDGLDEEDEPLRSSAHSALRQVGCGSRIGAEQLDSIIISYSHDQGLIRHSPRLRLKDLEDASFLPIVSSSFGEKIDSLEIFANGYKLLEIGTDEIKVGDLSTDPPPGDYTEEELGDPWIKMRPTDFCSAFRLRFWESTPRRLGKHSRLRDGAL